MIPAFIYRLLILAFGTLYPSYSSYKAIKNKDVREYSRWMMYWVCFGIFSATEVVTDIFLSFWFPFYYELKILFILWLMSPYGNGARVMYKNIIHPELNRRETVIDSYIETAKALGLESIVKLFRKSSELMNFAFSYVMQMSHIALISQLNKDSSVFPSLVSPRTEFQNENQVNLFEDTSDQPNKSNNSHLSLLNFSSPLAKSTDSLDLLALQTEIMELEDDNEQDRLTPIPSTNNNSNKVKSKEKVVKKTKKQTKDANESEVKVVKRTQRKAALKARKTFTESDSE